ncbi:MAG: hypothetical protein HC836_40005 [Richelia sp. RM2_1_2]|nr:hypothetical protein [Richelia sp. RM2_1_2]
MIELEYLEGLESPNQEPSSSVNTTVVFSKPARAKSKEDDMRYSELKIKEYIDKENTDSNEYNPEMVDKILIAAKHGKSVGPMSADDALKFLGISNERSKD